jgi:mycothiol synthase
MAEITTRPVDDEDDLDDLNEGNNEWSGDELVRSVMASSGDDVVLFHVAESEGRVVGYFDVSIPTEENPTQMGFSSIWVRPDARGRGTGSEIWDELVAAAKGHGAKRLTSRVDAADESSKAWVQKRGAVLGGAHLESRLELTDDLPLSKSPEGVYIETLEVDPTETSWRAAHAATVRLRQDTPDAETNPTPIPWEVFRALVVDPWQFCVAKTPDGAIVGLTCVFVKNAGTRTVNTILTAVNREWRGKGLATALKTAHAMLLRDAGWKAIVTQNMEGNDHILAANKRLGFAPSNTALEVLYDLPT